MGLAGAIIPEVYSGTFERISVSDSDVSVNSLLRVLGTSGLSASTIDRVASLVGRKHARC